MEISGTLFSLVRLELSALSLVAGSSFKVGDGAGKVIFAGNASVSGEAVGVSSWTWACDVEGRLGKSGLGSGNGAIEEAGMTGGPMERLRGRPGRRIPSVGSVSMSKNVPG